MWRPEVRNPTKVCSIKILICPGNRWSSSQDCCPRYGGESKFTDWSLAEAGQRGWIHCPYHQPLLQPIPPLTSNTYRCTSACLFKQIEISLAGNTEIRKLQKQLSLSCQGFTKNTKPQILFRIHWPSIQFSHLPSQTLTRLAFPFLPLSLCSPKYFLIERFAVELPYSSLIDELIWASLKFQIKIPSSRRQHYQVVGGCFQTLVLNSSGSALI